MSTILSANSSLVRIDDSSVSHVNSFDKENVYFVVYNKQSNVIIPQDSGDIHSQFDKDSTDQKGPFLDGRQKGTAWPNQLDDAEPERVATNEGPTGIQAEDAQTTSNWPNYQHDLYDEQSAPTFHLPPVQLAGHVNHTTSKKRDIEMETSSSPIVNSNNEASVAQLSQQSSNVSDSETIPVCDASEHPQSDKLSLDAMLENQHSNAIKARLRQAIQIMKMERSVRLKHFYCVTCNEQVPGRHKVQMTGICKRCKADLAAAKRELAAKKKRDTENGELLTNDQEYSNAPMKLADNHESAVPKFGRQNNMIPGRAPKWSKRTFQ